MSKTIHKYTFPGVGKQFISMPVGAQVIHVGEQYGNICLWAIVDNDDKFSDNDDKFSDNDDKFSDREFFISGTGWDIPNLDEGFEYWPLGSVNVDGNMWHVIVPVEMECEEEVGEGT